MADLVCVRRAAACPEGSERIDVDKRGNVWVITSRPKGQATPFHNVNNTLSSMEKIPTEILWVSRNTWLMELQLEEERCSFRA